MFRRRNREIEKSYVNSIFPEVEAPLSIVLCTLLEGLWNVRYGAK